MTCLHSGVYRKNFISHFSRAGARWQWETYQVSGAKQPGQMGFEVAGLSLVFFSGKNKQKKPFVKVILHVQT